jgi:hypothetical protein
MPGRDSAAASYSGRASSPCNICQRFRLQCTLSEADDGDDSCLPCQNRGSECSFVASPPVRKRKLNGHLANDGKRRLVPPLPHARTLACPVTMMPEHVSFLLSSTPCHVLPYHALPLSCLLISGTSNTCTPVATLLRPPAPVLCSGPSR